MEKTITIDGKKVKFKTSAALPGVYRRETGRDLFVDMARLTEEVEKGMKEDGTSALSISSLELFENLAYSFAKHADPDGVPESSEEWLEQFETFSIFGIYPQLIEMWTGDNKGTSKLKKKNAKSTVKLTRHSS